MLDIPSKTNRKPRKDIRQYSCQQLLANIFTRLSIYIEFNKQQVVHEIKSANIFSNMFKNVCRYFSLLKITIKIIRKPYQHVW